MMRKLLVVPVLFSLALTACSSFGTQYFVGGSDYELASRQAADGKREVYRLELRGTPSVRVVTTGMVDRPHLGIRAVELTKPLAEGRGVRPYTGLLVKSVAPHSAAAEAGVLANDVLLTLNGAEMVYLPQLEAFEKAMRSDHEITATVLRGQDRHDLALVARMLREEASSSEEIPLEASETPHRPYAGVTLRGIPRAWCQRIFGADREAVIVTNVEVGSPAWLAGVRGGDLIESVDGAPTPSVHELSRRIHEVGMAGQSMQWRVRRGPGQEHEATIALHDYSGSSGMHIPLVFYLSNGVYEDRWTLGPLGLLMSNRNRYVPDSTTRQVQTTNVFSAVLGLFRVETSPRETEVRLLWFIRFDT